MVLLELVLCRSVCLARGHGQSRLEAKSVGGGSGVASLVACSRAFG